MSTLPINDSPRYVKIAVDIAYKIYKEELKEGHKLRGSSALAGEYNVSPETIRRAVILLQNMNVVEIREKSGTYVESKENAKEFIDKFTTTNSINNLMTNIRKLRMEKMEIEKKIDENIELLIEHSIHFKNIDTTSHYEVSISSQSHLVEKTIIEAQFWQNTNATIIAIKRDNDTFLSPGPYFQFKEEDIICFVSSEENISKVKQYVNS
ncbi:GntR family transcriptional regulator [Tissierella sp. MSJ-40]|uniref:GntR family transcriptional regulator n=1 Tax=Tissierella simiarum TaxID=2841534 RepID=A0ABS6E235_9FIRM|nr:TrkA C-terminal domain-containing protein [Tissierella simiarum]MBU5436970.1 GntR family transcriptional regulator [Tissierella simiarum]